MELGMPSLLLEHRFTAKPTSRTFSHGHTYQGHPVACAAALEVQRIIREENLVENVRNTGAYLENLLHTHLDSHHHVGDIRGRGLFWGVRRSRASSLRDC